MSIFTRFHGWQTHSPRCPKAYEDRFRPDRLRLEDLEAFAQQLLTAGLAQNEAPKSGKQLYDRHVKKDEPSFSKPLPTSFILKFRFLILTTS